MIASSNRAVTQQGFRLSRNQNRVMFSIIAPGNLNISARPYFTGGDFPHGIVKAYSISVLTLRQAKITCVMIVSVEKVV